MRLDKAEVDRRLSIIREIAASIPLTDCHVHPFEVLFDDGRYGHNPHQPGVFSTGDACYVPPAAGVLDLETPAGPSPAVPKSDLWERMTLLAMRRLYVHTGPQCWADQSSLAGIARTVLLPVAQRERTAEARTAEMAAMFGGDPRFLIGYSLPNGLEPGAVEADVRRAVAAWGIRVLKVHPNLSGHDLRSEEGRARVEALLEASRRVRLPVILHGGASPSLGDQAAARFADLQNLRQVDLGRTDQPVVIAHAGAFGLGAEETGKRVLPLLHWLLARFDHLLVDTSALPVDVLRLLLAQVNPERIVFGSDAFYELPWKAAVKLYWLLEQHFHRPSELFARIAGVNPERLFGKIQAWGRVKSALIQAAEV